jgi:ankyrin repeat protein
VVRLLLDRKAEIEAPLGQRPVNNASPGFLAAWSGDADKVELLAKHGANLRRRMMLAGIVDVSPLEMAVSSRDDETIRTLARNGVDINEPNALSITALSFAAMSGESGQVKLLIDLGANVNGSDKFGMTPLLWASLIDHGDYRLIEALVKAGADVKARTKQGESALTLAGKWQQPDVARIFKQAGVTD